MGDFLTEPMPIEDEFCMKLAMIQDLGANVRLIFSSEQPCFELGGKLVSVVRKKLVLPFDAIGPGLQTTARFLAVRGSKFECGHFVRLVT